MFKRQQNIIWDLGIVRHRLIIVLFMRVPSLFYPWLKKELFQEKFDHYKWGGEKKLPGTQVIVAGFSKKKKPS